MNLQVNRKRRDILIDVQDDTFERIRNQHSLVAHEMLVEATARPVFSLRQSPKADSETGPVPCPIGEVAFQGREDPLEMRRRLMAPHLVARGLLDVVAVMADWQTPLPRGKARGLAFVHAFGTWMAEVVHVSRHAGGIRIDKIFCAADAGLVLDERGFRNRILSGVLAEISAATGKDDGATGARPDIEVEVELLANSERRSSGGRPAVPSVAPALANAIYALTGERIRHQPLFDDVTFV